ncbi:sodium:solute symporter family protein [Microbacterium sp. 22242]|uniref:sodium:solute symporter family protein n=1 Tax=Microbacterium sp. 22242 TaxID=3453896 RepID=UPI003F86F078
MMTAIIIIGIVLIGVIGVVGRRREKGMSGWLVAGRKLPTWTSWFLQAGESLTTFSFLGLAGIAFVGGVSATYAVGYLTACLCIQYFVNPRLRNIAASRGYLTMADFFHDRFRSRTLSVIVAVVGALFLIPYLELQLTGLGLIVQLATGSASARGLSMVLASALVIVFVLWGGIRGIARVSIFKDFGMLIALAVVTIGVVAAAGSFPDTFAQVAKANDVLFTTNAPGFGPVWWISSLAITTIGAGFQTFPHLWPPTLAAKSGNVLRSNIKWLAVYQLLLFLPITVGMVAVLQIPKSTIPNQVLLTSAQHALPEWLVAVVAVFGAAAAMVPAGAIAMGIGSLVANNLTSSLSERGRFVVTRVAIVAAMLLALALGLVKSDIGALLLLTYGGLAQLAPAVASGIGRKVRVSTIAVSSGIVVGTLFVAVTAFAKVPLGDWDSGFIGLGLNLVVFGIVEAIVRVTRGTAGGSVAAEIPAEEVEVVS